MQNNTNLSDKKYSKAIKYAKNNLNKDQFEHALRVGQIIIEKNLDDDAINAAILHDTLYLQKISFDELTKKFGNTTAGLTKEIALTEELLIKNYSRVPNDTLSSLILSISSDLQTIIIQIAEVIDLLKNNKGYTADVKKLAKLAENIYYPLSVKLGLGDFSWKLQDYSFKINDPQGYEKVKKLVNKSIEEREEKINKMKLELEELFKNKIEVQIFGRPKNFKSIFNKLKKVPLKKMYDIYGLRIICNKEIDCYEALGYIHSKYDFIKEAFDDYIAKEGKGAGKTGYKSIHTAILRGNDIFEIQIRTWEMHLRTESSIYWEYKRLGKDKNFEKELSWERQLIEWQKSIGEQTNKRKLVNKKIFAFTPKHDVIALKKGATVLDFAFMIHTEIGKRAQKAIVNGNLVQLDTVVNNLDTIEIITSQNYTIKRNWLSVTNIEKAKQKIRSHFNIKPIKKIAQMVSNKNVKKIKLGECCHPLPGEDVIGIKTTKRKIIIHKRDCENIKNIPKERLIEIGFEQPKGKTKLNIKAIDRPGLLREILSEIKKQGITINHTNFQIKKSGFVDAVFEIEATNVTKVDKLIEKLEQIQSIQSAERQ